MALLELNRDPSPRDLKWFGVVMLAFGGLVGALLQWRFAAATAATWVWGSAAALCAVYYAVAALRRPIFVGWMTLTYPIGWLLSHLMMGVVFYLVVTPIGLVLRLMGRDALDRKVDKGVETYWKAHESRGTAPDSYFRQF
jgi:hypothetical protein